MSTLDQIDELGGHFERKPIERPQQIQTQVYRLRRQHLYPPEVWAEMQAIWNGERE